MQKSAHHVDRESYLLTVPPTNPPSIATYCVVPCVMDHHRPKLILHGSEFSYFSMKTLSGLRWITDDEELEFRVGSSRSNQLRERAGTHQIPVLEVIPEGWIVADSTPIFRAVEFSSPGSPFWHRDVVSWGLYGPRKSGRVDPFTACVVALLEEFLDEWTARLAVHTRWNKAESANESAPKMAAENVIGEGWEECEADPDTSAQVRGLEDVLRHWGPRACRATGISTDSQQVDGDAELLRLFTEWNTHVGAGASDPLFLLGNAPCAVDAVLLGSLRAHFLKDKWPRDYLAHLSNIKPWAERAAAFSAEDDAQNVTQEALAPGNLPKFIHFLLSEMTATPFAKFVLGNANGLANGHKSFTVDVRGEPWSFLCRPAVQTSRTMLRTFFGAVLADSRAKGQFESLLDEYGLSSIYSPISDPRSRL